MHTLCMPDYEKMSIKQLQESLRRLEETRQTVYRRGHLAADVGWFDRFCALNARTVHLQKMLSKQFRRQQLLQLLLCCRHFNIAMNSDVLSHIFEYL